MTLARHFVQAVCRGRAPCLHALLQRENNQKRAGLQLCRHGSPFSLEKKKERERGEGREKKKEALPCLHILQTCTPCTRDMKRPMQLTAPNPTARARRRLARRMSTVATWWASLPYPKPTALTPTTLQRITGIDMQRLAPALHALGWQRILRRVHGKPTTLWLPPGSPVTRRPRGRPRLHDQPQSH